VKVAQVCLRFDAPGGVEGVVRDLSGRLRRHGVEVEVFAGDLVDESRWIRRTEFPALVDGVPVHWFPVYRKLLPHVTFPLLTGLVAALTDFRPDVVHAHSHRYGHVWEASAVAKRLGVPFVVTPHYHPPDPDEPLWQRSFLRLQDAGFGVAVYRRAAAILASTEQERARLSEFAPRDRIRLIPDAIALGEWQRPSGPLPRGLPERYVLYAGRIAVNKGLPTLVDALARIPAARRVPLVLMGHDWGQREIVERRARDAGVFPDLHWLGHLQDPEQYRAVFRRASAFVLPSDWEAFGIVLLEAMAAGIPIVATAVGGMPEVLDHGRCGQLVPARDPESLSRAILLALEGEASHRADVRAARDWVRRFDWDRIVDEYRDLYGRLIAA
jgi:glycosyltransferase involved in cell wall biosynthesis